MSTLSSQSLTMNFEFPVSPIKISYPHDCVKRLTSPILNYDKVQVDEKEFFMEISTVAKYLVRNGKEILIEPQEQSDPQSIALFLNGSVLGALLHQRHLLPLHGASFSLQEKGIVICGISGAGKSSVAAAFLSKGAKFISDDITPLQISETQTILVSFKNRLKLWDDSIEKLKLPKTELQRIRPMIEKFYVPSQNSGVEGQKLDQLYILEVHNKNEYCVQELRGLDKYNAIRNQIYRNFYLKGMPQTRKAYFSQILKLSSQISVKVVTRPQLAEIKDTMEFIQKEIEG